MMKLCVTNTLENGHKGSVLGCAFVNGNRYAFTCGEDRQIRLWNVTDNTKAYTVQVFGSERIRYELRDVAVSGKSDHSKFACCGKDKVGFVFDVKTCSMIQVLKGHDHPVQSICFAGDYDLAVTGSMDCTMRVFDLKSKSHHSIQTLRGFRDSVSCVRWHDQYKIMGCSVDGSIRTFDVRMGKVITDKFAPHKLTSMFLFKNGKQVLVSSIDPGQLFQVDMSTGLIVEKYEGHANQENRIPCAVLRDIGESLFACGSERGEIMVWKENQKSPMTLLAPHGQNKSISCLAACDGKLLSCCYGEGELPKILSLIG